MHRPISFLQCSLIIAVLLQNSRKHWENFFYEKKTTKKESLKKKFTKSIKTTVLHMGLFNIPAISFAGKHKMLVPKETEVASNVL